MIYTHIRVCVCMCVCVCVRVCVCVCVLVREWLLSFTPEPCLLLAFCKLNQTILAK